MKNDKIISGTFLIQKLKEKAEQIEVVVVASPSENCNDMVLSLMQKREGGQKTHSSDKYNNPKSKQVLVANNAIIKNWLSI